MSKDTASFSLAGTLLVAMPSLVDATFRKCVIFLCAHSSSGAMGLIVNRPMPKMSLDDLVANMGLSKARPSDRLRLYAGGPADQDRGFVLHSKDYEEGRETMDISPDFAMTATRGVIAAIARGMGPERRLVAMGYAGWGPGQLEGELRENAWLTVGATSRLVFSRNDHGKWAHAIETLGVEPSNLSGISGHA